MTKASGISWPRRSLQQPACGTTHARPMAPTHLKEAARMASRWGRHMRFKAPPAVHSHEVADGQPPSAGNKVVNINTPARMALGECAARPRSNPAIALRLACGEHCRGGAEAAPHSLR